MSQTGHTLITGSTGFIGTALAAELIRSGAEHLVLTSLHGRGLAVLACDLLDADSVAELIARVQPARIYHLAGSPSNELNVALDTTVLATQHILEAARKLPQPCRILLVGSAAEYGRVRPEDNPVRESLPLLPVSVYGFAKKTQTALMEFYTRIHGLDIVMARPFNISGTGAPQRLFVGALQAQMDRYDRGDHSPIVTGNLDAQLDYLEVARVAKALVTILERGEKGVVYNVGSGTPIHMRDLLKQMLKHRNIPWSAVVEKRNEHRALSAVALLYADISKLKALEALP